MFIMLMKGEKWQHGLLVLGQDQYKEHTKVPDKPAGRAVLGPLCCTAPGNVLVTSGVSWSLQLRTQTQTEIIMFIYYCVLAYRAYSVLNSVGSCAVVVKTSRDPRVELRTR